MFVYHRTYEKANASVHEKYLVECFYHRPAEESYAVEIDEEQFNNLAGNPIFLHEIEEHRNALVTWMKMQNDPRIPVDKQNAYEKRYWEN